jgi:hypothetical protein
MAALDETLDRLRDLESRTSRLTGLASRLTARCRPAMGETEGSGI